MDILNRLYRECSLKSSNNPAHYQALANAASVLGSRGCPGHMVRDAVVGLCVAFQLSC